MQNYLMPLEYEGNIIRTAGDAVTPLFRANDVCNILGFTNQWKALKDLVDKDDLTNSEVVDMLGRKQTANFINESGLYSLIFGSRLPKAKDFKRWVTSEVLPAIRKSGGYTSSNATPPQPSPVGREYQDRFESTYDLSLYHELISTQKELIESQREQIKLHTMLNEVKLINTRRAWSVDDDMQLIDLRAEGLSYSQIGEKMDRTRGSVSRRYSRIGG